VNLWSALKSALRFPAYGGQGVQTTGFHDWWMWEGALRGYDFHEAAGDLYRNGVVMACAAFMMRAFPEAPLHVTKENEDGEEDNVARHPLTLAFKRPNPFYGSDCLWQRIIFDRSIFGQAFLYKERNAGGTITALYHIPQHRLIPQWDTSGKEFIDHYLFRVDQRQDKIPIKDLVHFRFGGDPIQERNGLSPLSSALREIGALNESALYRGQILRNMGVPSHLLQSKDPTRPMTAEQAKLLHALWAERVAGANRGKPIIPNWALEAVKIGMSPAELDLGSMTYESADLVCGLFGLSAMVIGISSGTAHKTYSNFAEAREAAYEGALVPAWKQVAEDLTLQLLPDYSDDETECVEFDLSKVRALADDENALSTRAVNELKSGGITRGQFLTKLGLQSTDEDDVYYIPQGTEVLPAEHVGAKMLTQQAEQKQEMQQAALDGMNGAAESSGDAAAVQNGAPQPNGRRPGAPVA